MTRMTAQHVLCQYLEAINDIGATEEAEQLIKRHSDCKSHISYRFVRPSGP